MNVLDMKRIKDKRTEMDRMGNVEEEEKRIKKHQSYIELESNSIYIEFVSTNHDSIQSKN